MAASGRAERPWNPYDVSGKASIDRLSAFVMQAAPGVLYQETLGSDPP